MVTSCTYVGSADWINQAIMFGSLLIAFAGVGVLTTLRGRRLEFEQANDAETPEPGVSMVNA